MEPSDQAIGTLEGIGHQQHTATCEYRIFGPPGTGKTTHLARQVRRATERYGPASVLVTSFSRAAAAELAGRDLPIHRDRIGTLHSHCYRALDRPEIAEAHVEEWNRRYPALELTPHTQSTALDGEDSIEEEDGARAKPGDPRLAELNRLRGRLVPVEAWPKNVAEFERRWTSYKRHHGLFDFTDLIENCLHNMAVAPHTPAVIFADEAQDLNPMQLSLVRKWGERAEYFILALDDDQTIYAFTGAAPEAILGAEIPNPQKIVLKQSYRIPRAIHRLSHRLIRQVSQREEKVYLPRPEEEGAVYRLSSGGYRAPEYFILKTAVKHLERGKRLMFLASCSYMLFPIIAVLRKHAIPFHNPYRRSNGFWNPIRIGTKDSAANRILALLSAHPQYGEGHRDWNERDLRLWAEWLRAKGILKPGAMELFKAGDGNKLVTIATLDQTFEPAALDSLAEAFEGGLPALLDWWRRRITLAVHRRVQFPADIVAAHGPDALIKTPQVVVGTIHSVKGGEADVVYLFPDLSPAADAQYQRSGPPRDAVIRLFYVGLTRAREVVYLCQRETAMAVSI